MEQTTSNIEQIRTEIDAIDMQLIQLLGKRMRFAQSVGLYKKERNIPILQVSRWQEILNSAIEKGAKEELSEIFITQFLTAIHDESIRHQTLVLNS
jgi:chorismate mutase